MKGNDIQKKLDDSVSKAMTGFRTEMKRRKDIIN